MLLFKAKGIWEHHRQQHSTREAEHAGALHPSHCNRTIKVLTAADLFVLCGQRCSTSLRQITDASQISSCIVSLYSFWGCHRYMSSWNSWITINSDNSVKDLYTSKWQPLYLYWNIFAFIFFFLVKQIVTSSVIIWWTAHNSRPH